ncbi:MAG: nitroreductase [Pseudomonadota bacterium]
MPDPRPDVLDFLLTRRSRPAKTLAAPGPEPAALEQLLTAALRVPDHGKLEPWRLIVIEGAALNRIATEAENFGTALGLEASKIEKQAKSFRDGPVIVAVVSSPKPSEKIPLIEQQHSAGAVCLSLLNAALAAGWGANWLSGWAAHDPQFLSAALGLSGEETLAGFIHIGKETTAPPERPRPDIKALTEWVAQ